MVGNIGHSTFSIAWQKEFLLSEQKTGEERAYFLSLEPLYCNIRPYGPTNILFLLLAKFPIMNPLPLSQLGHIHTVLLLIA